MKTVRQLLFRLRALFGRRRLEAEMQEEMRRHVEMDTAARIADGAAPEEARYASQRQFGNIVRIQEAARDARGFPAFEGVVKDVRFAARALRRSPGFAATAILTLALGIGANTSAFSVLNALLFHVPNYPNARALVRLNRVSPAGETGAHSAANFLDFRAQNTVFSHVAAVRFGDFNLGESGQPADRIRGMSVSADFFPLLGLGPELGRTFAAHEDTVGAPPVVVLSHGTWKRRFGGDPAVVGRTVRLDGESTTVIGVMPAAFDDLHLWGRVDAWRPVMLPEISRADRENSNLRVIARLQPGLTLEQAESGMRMLTTRLAEQYPATNTGLGVRLVSLVFSAQSEGSRRITWLVSGLAGFVLLIACANLANLQFVRNAARGREYAIRAALGASRTQLIRFMLAESVLLAIAGGAAGLLGAYWTNVLVAQSFSLPDGSPLAVALDRRVLAFTSIVSILTGIGFGLLPAWMASRARVGEALKQGGRGTTGAGAPHRLRHVLSVMEIALALALLAGAGFFVRGLQRVIERDAGWRTDGVVTASLSLRGQNYATAAARGAFHQRLHAQLKALPGVEHVAIATSAPTAGYDIQNTFVVEGRVPPGAGRTTLADVAAVTPGYFATLGIPLLQGRDFSEDDRAGSPAVVVINETMARQLWPGENPIGKRIGGATPFMSNPREVIGVVRDVRAAATLADRAGGFQFYRSLAQWSFNSAMIVIRASRPAEALAQDLRRALAGLDPDQAVFRVETVRDQIEDGLRSVDAAARMLVGFALLGLVLAAVGIYGVIAHTVVQRTNEIGIRLALGAQMRDVLALILGGGVRLTVLGIALGLVGTFGISRLLRSLAPEFANIDLLLTAAITAILAAVALFACWLPARRATKVDPILALRAD